MEQHTLVSHKTSLNNDTRYSLIPRGKWVSRLCSTYTQKELQGTENESVKYWPELIIETHHNLTLAQLAAWNEMG